MKDRQTKAKRIAIVIGKYFLNIIYFFEKVLFPRQNKVVMLSRQSNNANLDYKLLEEEILNRTKKVKVKILCKKIDKSIIDKFKYCLYILNSMYHIATAKVCIVDGYSIPVSILKHKKNLEIIQIWHASGAIKKFGYQILDKKEGRDSKLAKIMNMHKNYNHVLAPSKETAKFYTEAFGIEEDKIIFGGLPRLDYILDERIEKEKKEEFYLDYPEFREKRTVLYVPTFRKDFDVTDSIRKLINSINFSKYNLIVKLHPLDQNDEVNKYVIDKKYTTFDLIKIADYVITDYSAVAFETSILNKPLYFYVYDLDNYERSRGLNINLYEEINNSTSKSIKEIIRNIENENYDFEELKRFTIKFMGTNYFNNTKKLVDFIFNYLSKDVKKDEKTENNVNESSKEELNV